MWLKCSVLFVLFLPLYVWIVCTMFNVIKSTRLQNSCKDAMNRCVGFRWSTFECCSMNFVAPAFLHFYYGYGNEHFVKWSKIFASSRTILLPQNTSIILVIERILYLCCSYLRNTMWIHMIIPSLLFIWMNKTVSVKYFSEKQWKGNEWVICVFTRLWKNVSLIVIVSLFSFIENCLTTVDSHDLNHEHEITEYAKCENKQEHKTTMWNFILNSLHVAMIEIHLKSNMKSEIPSLSNNNFSINL